jgi:hypothetical protein
MTVMGMALVASATESLRRPGRTGGCSSSSESSIRSGGGAGCDSGWGFLQLVRIEVGLVGSAGRRSGSGGGGDDYCAEVPTYHLGLSYTDPGQNIGFCCCRRQGQR